MLTKFVALCVLLSGTAGAVYAQKFEGSCEIIFYNHTAAEYKEATRYLNEAPGIKVLNHDFPVVDFQYQTETFRQNAMAALMESGFEMTTRSGLPVDFPILPPRAAPEQILVYQQQKKNWIANNPKRYELLQTPTHQQIPRDEFEQMSPEKQQHLLEHPHLYSIE